MKKKIATLVLVLMVGTLLGVVMVAAQQPQPAEVPQRQMEARPPHNHARSPTLNRSRVRRWIRSATPCSRRK